MQQLVYCTFLFVLLDLPFHINYRAPKWRAFEHVDATAHLLQYLLSGGIVLTFNEDIYAVLSVTILAKLLQQLSLMMTMQFSAAYSALEVTNSMLCTSLILCLQW